MEYRLPYRAEYAKSNRSKCKGCYKKIVVSTLRLAVMVQNRRVDSKIPSWYHIRCFFKKHRPFTVGDIAYFANLRYTDQIQIEQQLDARTIRSPKNKRKKTGMKKLMNEDEAIVKSVIETNLDETEPTQNKIEEFNTELKLKIQTQNKELYYFKDSLVSLTEKELLEILYHNGPQYIPRGKTGLIDAVADILTFGALTIVKIPNHLKTKHSFLDNYNSRVVDRLFEHVVPSANTKYFNNIHFISDIENVIPSPSMLLNYDSEVDPDSGLENVDHVYVEGKNRFSVVLTLTDIQRDKNSFYKIQLLKDHKGTRNWVFRKWGRIGTTNTKLNSYGTIDQALEQFEKIYHKRTKNNFGFSFKKVRGYYVPVDVDYNVDNYETSNSKLEIPIQKVIKLLFDVKLMNQVMSEFGIDIEIMPLGKLSNEQLIKGYTVLYEILKLIEKGANQYEIIGASNKFYSLIPHNFGTGQPVSIDTQKMHNAKVEMPDCLNEIETAYGMLNDQNYDDTLCPIDVYYKQLKTEIKVLDKNTKEFMIIEQYVNNTHGETHIKYDLEILEIFKIKREEEEERYKPFKKLHNRKLLWHGSRVFNFVGILSHGLTVAPPEASCSGYMFGKGIYFADTVSKSANYCYTSQANNTGLLMLCEVALGNMVEYVDAHFVKTLPENKHSVKGIGQTQPNPDRTVIREDGVEIPCGLLIKNDQINSSLLYN